MSGDTEALHWLALLGIADEPELPVPPTAGVLQTALRQYVLLDVESKPTQVHHRISDADALMLYSRLA